MALPSTHRGITKVSIELAKPSFYSNFLQILNSRKLIFII